MTDFFTFLTWPVIGLAVIIVVFVLVRAFAVFYVRVPPNKAAFFYGARSGRRKAARLAQKGIPGAPDVQVLPPGTVVVTGGGRLRKPIIESVDFLDLSEITLPQIVVKNMPNIETTRIRHGPESWRLQASPPEPLQFPGEALDACCRETRIEVGVLDIPKSFGWLDSSGTPAGPGGRSRGPEQGGAERDREVKR